MSTGNTPGQDRPVNNLRARLITSIYKSQNELLDIFLKVCERTSRTSSNTSTEKQMYEHTKKDMESYLDQLIQTTSYQPETNQTEIVTQPLEIEKQYVDELSFTRAIDRIDSQMQTNSKLISEKFESLTQLITGQGKHGKSDRSSRETNGQIPENDLIRPHGYGNLYAQALKTTLNTELNGMAKNDAKKSTEIKLINNGGGSRLNSKHKSPVISGTNSSSMLSTVVVRRTNSNLTYRNAIFISRLSPHTSSQDIMKFLQNKNIEHPICTRMNTKHNTYSSFHIQVNDNDMERMLNGDEWPQGSLISKFYGRLKSNQIFHESNTQNTKNSENHIQVDLSTNSDPLENTANQVDPPPNCDVEKDSAAAQQTSQQSSVPSDTPNNK